MARRHERKPNRGSRRNRKRPAPEPQTPLNNDSSASAVQRLLEKAGEHDDEHRQWSEAPPAKTVYDAGNPLQQGIAILFLLALTIASLAYCGR